MLFPSAIIGVCILIIGFVLYCCLRVSTSYDKEVDDEQQIKFLQQINHMKKLKL